MTSTFTFTMKLTIWGVHFTEVSILKELGHQHHGSYSFFREESLCPFTRPLPPLLSPELPLSRAGCLSLACARTATFNVVFSRLTVFTRHDVSSARSFWRVCQDPTLGHGWAPATGFPARASSLRPAGVAVLPWQWGCQHVGGRLVPCAGWWASVSRCDCQVGRSQRREHRGEGSGWT